MLSKIIKILAEIILGSNYTRAKFSIYL